MKEENIFYHDLERGGAVFRLAFEVSRCDEFLEPSDMFDTFEHVNLEFILPVANVEPIVELVNATHELFHSRLAWELIGGGNARFYSRTQHMRVDQSEGLDLHSSLNTSYRVDNDTNAPWIQTLK